MFKNSLRLGKCKISKHKIISKQKVVPCTYRNEGEIMKLDMKFWSNLEMLHNK